jgi:hypothetical protein
MGSSQSLRLACHAGRRERVRRRDEARKGRAESGNLKALRTTRPAFLARSFANAPIELWPTAAILNGCALCGLHNWATYGGLSGCSIPACFAARFPNLLLIGWRRQ